MIMAGTIQEGIALYHAGKYTDALAVFLSLLDADMWSFKQDDGFDLAYYIGLSYVRLHRYDESVFYLERVINGAETRKRVNQCRFVLAVVYDMTGKRGMADAELQQLLSGGYRTAEVYSALAYIEWENKRPDTALQYYQEALEINPSSPSALNGLGYVLACTERDLVRALTLCKRAFDMHPKSAAFADSLGWVYYKLGLLDEAQNYIRQAKERDKENPEIDAHYKLICADIFND